MQIKTFKETPQPKCQESAKKPGKQAKMTSRAIWSPVRSVALSIKLDIHIIPRNPEKAIDISPIVIKAMGPPWR